MAGRNRDRQRAERRRANQELLREVERRRARRRRLIIAGSTLLAIAAFALVFVLLRNGDDGETVTADDDTTSTTAAGATTTAATASAAGKPCVALADPLPPGAPAVPVKTGPPPTTLIKEDLKAGTGAIVGAADTVKANYIGVSCSTGKIFDSSYSRGQPAEFPLNQVIVGWQQGLPGMKVGGQRLLGIPAEMAYGKEGRPPTILADEALWFVVEIIEAKAS
jgi:peptidylprolyl isomerase